MIGIDTIKLAPRVVARLRHVDEFKGLWSGLDEYTTGLQMLGDVAEYGVKVQKILTPLKEKEITEDIIKVLHATQIGHKGASSYKASDNRLPVMKDDDVVGFLETAHVDDVGPLMNKLVGWLNGALDNEDIHPLISIAVFTAIFLQIAPFDTGNIRTVRFLNLLLMMKAGYDYAPYAPLDKLMVDKAEEMYEALKNNQESLESGKPDWDEWLTFFFNLLVEQTIILRTRLEMKEKEIANIPTLSARILKLFEEHDRLQMKEIVQLTRGRRSTLKLRLNELVDQGYLRRHGRARSTWYSQV